MKEKTDELRAETEQKRLTVRDYVPAPMLARIETTTAQWAARQRTLGHEPSADLLHQITDAACGEWVRWHGATGSDTLN